ncbi:adenylate kinase [Metamycoplasma equirhinis]|uniref:adenylate kinase n=1 Tax=Metamycoplasma equirhinis TaxID=92402 RepID=UPI0035932D4C
MIDNCKKPNLIFLGAPGAGKGSVAGMLVKKYNYLQLSTGDMFRAEIKNQTPLGLKIKNILDSGKYVDDALTNELVEKKLSQLVAENKPFILDGYPRTIDQLNFLKSLENKNIKIGNVILLEITKQQIIDRLSKRRVCPNCKTIYHLELFPPLHGDVCSKCESKIIKRPDDEPEVIEKRLAVYKEQTECLIANYENQGLLIKINSYQNIDKVILDIEEALNW